MSTDLQLQALSDGLVRHFRHIAATRMGGVPIVNPALEVEAVGFTRTADGCLGVLITPWFLNLVLLPSECDDWQALPIGSEVRHVFASGSYVFQVAGDDAIGRYQTCSLLSPVFELADQETAVAVARAALHALHDTQQRDTTSSTHAAEVERRWRGEPVMQSDETAIAEAPAKPLTEVTLSRRAFLGGRLSDGRDGG